YSVRRAALLPPAEAMRPEPPATYRATLVERAGLQRWLSQSSRMILRDLERRPFKALLSITGIAMACAVMMLGTFFNDAVDFMVEVEFGMAQREDMAVTFVEPSSRRAIFELDSLPGVTRVEPYRGVPVRLRAGHRSYRTAIQGFEPGAKLHRTLDVNLKPIDLPTQGMVLTDHLGKILQVAPGDTITVEVLEGNRPHRQVAVAALVKQYIGVGAYMDLAALNRLMREAPAISGAFLAADRPQRELIYTRLKETPRVAGTEVSEYVIRNYYATIGDLLLTFVTFISALAIAITFGVVYNSARITLSERSREMASLRVLGFTRGEISYVLLGELALLTLSAIPMGFVLGYWLCWWFVQTVQQDLFRVPLIVEPATYALAAVVVLGSALVSGLIVRRRLDHLDLIAVLKTRE
ncbi:MAG: ABC transporter permease, partial [Pseudomonadota bacterium]